MQFALSVEDNNPPFFVVVGASGMDGLRDLCDLPTALPHELPAVLLVVLHRPSNHISHLRQVLARRSALPVDAAEATWSSDGRQIIYIARGQTRGGALRAYDRASGADRDLVAPPNDAAQLSVASVSY